VSCGIYGHIRYRVWLLEHHPVLSAVKDIQKKQLIDLIQELFKQREGVKK
jgi:hypothetical protein